MAKTKNRDYDREIQDFIERAKKHPEKYPGWDKKRNTRSKTAWRDYLEQVLGIAVENNPTYWENTRRAVLGKEKELPLPTQQELDEANTEMGHKKTTGQVFYRNKETGKFVSQKSIITY